MARYMWNYQDYIFVCEAKPLLFGLNVEQSWPEDRPQRVGNTFGHLDHNRGVGDGDGDGETKVVNPILSEMSANRVTKDFLPPKSCEKLLKQSTKCTHKCVTCQQVIFHKWEWHRCLFVASHQFVKSSLRLEILPVAKFKLNGPLNTSSRWLRMDKRSLRCCSSRW